MNEERYDVVVIGSGIGGLSCAALLAHRGYKTLVAEKLPFIGGRCSNIEYKGFKLSTGAICIESLIEEDVFKEVGAPFNIRIPHPQFVYYIDGKPHEVPDKGKLRATIALSSGKEEADRVMNAIRKAIGWQKPSNSITFYQWISQYTQNERTIGVFYANWPIYQVPAGEIFDILEVVGPMFSGYAVGGNIALMESLANVVRSNGDVWTRCRAKKILVEEGVAEGVVVEKGKKKEEVKISCKAVVSNAGPRKTVELAGRENVDKGYLKEMQETLRPLPWTEIQVASDRALVDFPGFAQINMAGVRRLNWICCPTILCPELAPVGKHLTYIGGWLPPNPPFDLDKELELTLQDARELIPGFDKAEILHVGFFLNNWPMYHSLFGYSLPQKTPIENLYNVGDGVFPYGTYGLCGCARSGKVVADDIKERIKPGG